jgi:hypothetical protein
MITQSELKELLHYDPDTGIFTWINPSKGRKGNPQKIRKDGYCYICIKYKKYLAHRLAWLYVYGKFPEVFIDHINMDKSNNRIENLRLVTYSGNSINKKLQKNNTSGYKGVTYNKKSKRYMAKIKIQQKEIYLGLFESIENAALAYKKAALKYHKDFINMNGVI